MYSSLLNKIEILDNAGLYKEADTALRKIISQELAPESYQQPYQPPPGTSFYLAYRPLALYFKNKNGLDLFALPKNLSTLTKAVQTGTQLPEEALRFTQAFYKDMRAIDGVNNFLKNYPDLYENLKQIDSQVRFLKGKNYWEWLGGIKNADQFKQELQNLNESGKLIKEFYKSGHGILDMKNIPLDDLQKIKAGIAGGKNAALAEEKFLSYIKQALMNYDPNLKNINNLTKTELVAEFRKLPGSMKSTHIGQLQLIQNESDNAKRALAEGNKIMQNAEKAGHITKVTADGEKAAAGIAQKLPVLNKILGPLGILLSLPAAYKWTKRIIAGDTDWTAKDFSEFVQDLLNLFAGISFMVPGGQLVSAVLGGLSLTLAGGTWAAEKLGGDGKGTEQEQKILGTYDYSEKDDGRRMGPNGQIIQLTPEQMKAEELRMQEPDIDALLSQATPNNYSDFNTWLGQNNQGRGELSNGLPDYSSMKMIDIFKALETWINSKDERFKNKFNWFTNPTEENKSKRAIFEQKYLSLFNTFKK